MGLPLASGHPDHTSAGTNKFTPEIWSGKLLRKFYSKTVFAEICNTDYEGEISQQGSKVIIRTTPDITINDLEIGGDLTYENPESPAIEFPINRGKYFAFGVDDVQKHQSDIKLMDNWSNDGGQQMKISTDRTLLGAVFTGAAATNKGATAGALSADINMGVAATPVLLTKTNIIDFIVNMGVVLDETDTPDEDRKLVLPAWACGLIKTSELKDASLSGDSNSLLRGNGRLGMIDRFTIYCSNGISNAGGEFNVIANHKSAITFAAQLTKMETLKNPTKFGDLVRSLMVYDFMVTHPDKMVHAVVAKG